MIFGLATSVVVTVGSLAGFAPSELHHTATSQNPWADRLLWLVVAVGTTTYVAGWRVARRNPRLAGVRHLVAYLGAVVLLAGSLVGPLDRAADLGLAAHMVQHMILVMAIPPLWLAARPYAIGMWGLPARARHRVARWLGVRGTGRRLLMLATPVAVFGASALIHVIWHDPALYDLAVRNSTVHAFQHFTFVVSALAWWWHGLRVPPRVHRPLSPAFRLTYLMGMAPIAMVIGMFIAFAPDPLYSVYVDMAAERGTDTLTDQQWGGTILWVMGAMMYLLVGLAGLAQDLSDEERRSRRAASETPRASVAAKPLPVHVAEA